MNKIISRKINSIEQYKKYIHTKKYGTIIAHEEYKNGKLDKQHFTLKKPNHNGYEPIRMVFQFYGKDIDIYVVKTNYLSFKYDLFPKQILIDDLVNFNSFDKLYCFWFGMDGNTYKITDPDPIPTVFQGKINSISHNLEACRKKLLQLKCVSNLNIQKNCYENWDYTGQESLYFIYKPDIKTAKEIMKETMSYNRDEIIINKLNLNKYLL